MTAASAPEPPAAGHARGPRNERSSRTTMTKSTSRSWATTLHAPSSLPREANPKASPAMWMDPSQNTPILESRTFCIKNFTARGMQQEEW